MPSAKLDHIVLLVPASYLSDPPSWLTSNFTLSPGGTHADERTFNKLILFADGTYIELIAFVDDSAENRRGHAWDLPFGIVDFALTVLAPAQFDYVALSRRLEESGTGVEYGEPAAGGRVGKDGRTLKWRTCTPKGKDHGDGPRGGGVDRGVLPFWCVDTTPREWRVPFDGDEERRNATRHACGVGGLARVKIGVESGTHANEVDRIRTALEAVVGSGDGKTGDGTVRVGVPVGEDGNIEVGKREELGEKLVIVLKMEKGKAPRKPIREPIGDGRVIVEFE